MKKLFFLAIFLSSSFLQLHGEEVPINLENENVDINARYGYFTYGFGLPGIFGLNLGLRNQHNHHGFEYGVGVVPLIFVYEIHAFTSYLYYPTPLLESQFYFGLGLSPHFSQTLQKDHADCLVRLAINFRRKGL